MCNRSTKPCVCLRLVKKGSRSPLQMTDDRKVKARADLKGSKFCFVGGLTIWVATVEATNPNGTFSYIRFSAGVLCWLLFLSGGTLAALALEIGISGCPFAVNWATDTVRGLGSVLGVVFLVAAVVFLNLKHRVKQHDAEAATNLVYLARAEFQSSNTYYLNRYSRAAERLEIPGNSPAPSLKSKEFLGTRGTNLANFITAGVQLAEFFQSGPANFAREVENSGRPQSEISNILTQFQRRNLKLWNEQNAVVEKTPSTHEQYHGSK